MSGTSVISIKLKFSHIGEEMGDESEYNINKDEVDTFSQWLVSCL